MARKILNKQRLKFYFPGKISWNPFLFWDKKAKKLPKNLIFAVFFFLVSLILLNSENKRIDQRILGLQTKIEANQRTAYEWEQILLERPDYRDGWIQLAAVYYQLGNKERAKEAILKAKTIDPTNETIFFFEKFLE